MHIHVHASPRVVRPRTASHNATQHVLIVCNACLRHQRQLNQSPRLAVVNCLCGVWRETGVHGWSIFIKKRQSTDVLRRCTSRKRLNWIWCKARAVSGNQQLHLWFDMWIENTFSQCHTHELTEQRTYSCPISMFVRKSCTSQAK